VNTKIKIVTKIVEELNHSNENSDTQKKAAIHNTTVRLAEFFKRSGEAKCMEYMLYSRRYVRMSVERGDLRTETGSEITAAQGQALETKYH
jgi:hypothetical protein